MVRKRVDAKEYVIKQLKKENYSLENAYKKPNVSNEEIKNIKEKIDILNFLLELVNNNERNDIYAN